MEEGRGTVRFGELGRHARLVLQEALGAFVRNDGLARASSLAFATALALIPALFLLSFVLSHLLGSSQQAMLRTAEFVADVIPRFGEVVLREVSAVARQNRGAGLLNLLLFAWAVTPVVAGLRRALGGIFRVQPRRAFWATKALDLAVTMLFLTGLAAMTGLDVFLKFLQGEVGLRAPSWFRTLLPFSLTVLLLLGLYGAFLPKVKRLHLVAGALVTTALWFLLRPVFAGFLTLHHGYGLAFGGFKSLFVVILWIYYSQVVLLFGAEVVAALHREETLLLHRMMAGRPGLPRLGRRRFLVEVPLGGLLFREGEPGEAMYHLLKGRVAIRKGGRELARIEAGGFFGEMSFLLGAPRSAEAVALEPCECLLIHGQNLDALMREYPETIREMLVELARRLRDTSAQVLSEGGEAPPSGA